MRRFFTPPNQLTLLRILLTPVFVSLFLSGQSTFRLWSFVVLNLAMLTDWYDGWVARRWGFVTRWGSFFDPLADKIFISAAFISFIFVDLVPAWAVWVVVTRDMGVTFLRSYAEMKGITFTTSFPAKVKTLAQFVVLYYILFAHIGVSSFEKTSLIYGFSSMIYSSDAMYWSMVTVSIITLATGVQYLIEHAAKMRYSHATAEKKPAD